MNANVRIDVRLLCVRGSQIMFLYNLKHFASSFFVLNFTQIDETQNESFFFVLFVRS